MNLISRIYEKDKPGKTFVVFQNCTLENELLLFISNMSYCDKEMFDIITMRKKFAEIFRKLGIDEGIFLDNAFINSSRYDGSKSGSCSFGYYFTSDIDNDVDVHNVSLGSSVENALENNRITYYLSDELFTDGESYSNDFGVKLTSGNESLFYSLSDEPVIRKYSISLAKDWILIREFLRDEVLFIFEGLNNRLVIRIKKSSVGGRNTRCQLDNESMVLDYLRTLTSEFDVLDIYSKLCELSLGDDVSVYPEITVSDLRKVNGNWKDVNVISVKNGEMDSVVRTIGDKKIKLLGNGNWSYVLSNDGVKFVVERGETFKLAVETKDNAEMDKYTGSGVLNHSLTAAINDVEKVGKLVRTKCRLGNNKG